jgi:hypothetical protein
MRILSNERGVALVTAMMLTLISLAIVLAALYFITQQTQLSAAGKRYRTALDAAHGGVEVFTKEVIPQLFNGYSTGQISASFNGPNPSPALQNLSLAMTTSTLCMSDKLNQNTSGWAHCPTDTNRLDPKTLYDARFTLRGLPLQPGFNVYAKLVDTKKGNSDTTGFELLDSGAGVTGTSSGVSPKHIPAIYRIEVQGEREKNPLERAKLTVLYAY